MGTDNIPIDNLNKPEFLKEPNRPPEAGFTTPWLRCNRCFFRVNVAIVSPEGQQPEGYFPLSKGEAKHTIKTVTDIIKLLEEELR